MCSGKLKAVFKALGILYDLRWSAKLQSLSATATVGTRLMYDGVPILVRREIKLHKKELDRLYGKASGSRLPAVVFLISGPKEEWRGKCHLALKPYGRAWLVAYDVNPNNFKKILAEWKKALPPLRVVAVDERMLPTPNVGSDITRQVQQFGAKVFKDAFESISPLSLKRLVPAN